MLSFIDISGDFRASTIEEKFIVAASVNVRQRTITKQTRLMHKLKRDILNNETLEIKSTSFINKDTLNDPGKNKHNFIQQVFEQCIDEYHKKLREYYSIIQKRSPNFPGLFGLYEAPPNFLSNYYT